MHHEVLVFQIVEQFSYLGVFLFAIFSGYILPIPEEIILLIVGYMAHAHLIHLVPAMLVVILAFIIGDNVLYRLVLKNNKHVTKFIHEVLSLKIITKNKALLEKNIGTTIFVSRFTPFLRFLGPVFAGYVKVQEKTFMLFNTLAIVIYAPFLIWVGYFFSGSFSQIAWQIGRVRHVIIIFVWILIGFGITRIVDYLFRKQEARELLEAKMQEQK